MSRNQLIQFPMGTQVRFMQPSRRYDRLFWDVVLFSVFAVTVYSAWLRRVII